jgi:deoxyribodipyrimidine photo-lyase
MVRGAVWFRSDLRLDDNPALIDALNACEEVIGVYIFSASQWNLHNESNIKHEFLINNLVDLERSLDPLNIPLLAINSKNYDSLSRDLLSFLTQHKVKHVFWNNEFGINESDRDISTAEALHHEGIEVSTHHDQVIYEPGFLKTGQGKPFSVFTPFKRRWIENFSMDFLDLQSPKVPAKETSIKSNLSSLQFKKSHDANMDLWPAGEAVAHQRLKTFLDKKVMDYSESRNIPILDGTSRISAYLALGIISPRRCILEALKLNQFEFAAGNNGICKWIDEIVWREFYRNIMHSFPHVSKNRPFNLATEGISWRHNKNEFEAWKTGNTGFPLIDAAMRQLLNEGWMHNRLRMVVAMFFSKNLLHDWRLGEQYFMQNLIDGDFASNNGGWQWSSSTGTDAAPYFRIFNPVTQSQTFDPEGLFIKSFVPELEHLSAKEIHLPAFDIFTKAEYPKPIVDLKLSRQRAIDIFKNNKTNTDV